MAIRTIETEISIKNEAEFRRQIKAVNNNLAAMRSEMAKVNVEYEGQANSVEALRKKQSILQQQYEQQQEKVRGLKEMLKSAKGVYDENSDAVLRWQKDLNRAETEMIQTGREAERMAGYLKEAEQSADGVASSIDKFGKEVKDAGRDVREVGNDLDEASGGLGQFQEAFGKLGEAAKSGNINGVVEALGSMKGALVGGAAVAGAKALADGIINITESTKEYRTILGTLEVSSKQAGYTQEQTTEIYRKFQAVLGDTQKAATATANLQALGLSQENLRVIMEEAIGAWATYGDSIPIDSLSESINETVQVGKVTGVFADALNWAGTNEDEFNERLAACADTAERANLVLSQLSQQGLQATGQAWVENNQDIVSANEAQEMMNASLAELGESLQPFATTLVETGAVLVDWAATIVDAISGVVDAFNNLFEAEDQAASKPYTLADYKVNGVLGTWGDIDYDAAKRMQEDGTFRRAMLVTGQQNQRRGGYNGSHAGGLDYVPFDGYVAELHRGEAVLTSGEANFLRDAMAANRALGGGQRSGGSVTNLGTSASGGSPRVYDLTIPVELSIDGATFARKEYKYRIAEDNRRGVSLAGRGGRR